MQKVFDEKKILASFGRVVSWLKDNGVNNGERFLGNIGVSATSFFETKLRVLSISEWVIEGRKHPIEDSSWFLKISLLEKGKCQ